LNENNIEGSRFVLRLFIAGNAFNSRIAIENLSRLQKKHPNTEFLIEVVDVNSQPEMALKYGIYISPALQVIEPLVSGIVYGNLNEEKVLEQILRL